ncbi:MAG TPA: hypothetical protein VIG30_15545 [Ktedonobacterales bacterium]|jgi:hypothetical protein
MPDWEPATEAEDEHLTVLFERAALALALSGLTAQDFLDDLPAARAEVVTEAYPAEFLRELERLQAIFHADNTRLG